MLGISKQLLKFCNKNPAISQAVRNYRGGMPGCNLPFKLDNPTRFSIFYFTMATIGFGAPMLVVMHQMARPYN